MTESNGSSVFFEMLQGRDGLPGRDGIQGPAGPPGSAGAPGRQGPPGPCGGGTLYTRWGKSTCPQVAGIEPVYSGIAGLGEASSTTEEVEPITSACPKCQSTAAPFDTEVEHKDMPMCMGQSMSNLGREVIISP